MKSVCLKVFGGRLEIGFSLHRELWRGRDCILSTQRIPGGDLVENSSFFKVQLATVYEFSDFDRGAMREKMAIFKERNRVCRGPKFFNGGDVDENRQCIERKMVAHYQDVMGTMLMKIVILLKETWSHITNIYVLLRCLLWCDIFYQ